MSEPLTPQRVEQAIQKYISDIGKLIGEHAAANYTKALAVADYDHAAAQARSEHREHLAQSEQKITEGIVNDFATIKTFEQLKAKLLATAREESLKQALRARQSMLDGARSLGSNLRAVT